MKTLPEHRCFGRVESGTPNKNALRFVRLGSDIKTVAGKRAENDRPEDSAGGACCLAGHMIDGHKKNLVTGMVTRFLVGGDTRI